MPRTRRPRTPDKLPSDARKRTRDEEIAAARESYNRRTKRTVEEDGVLAVPMAAHAFVSSVWLYENLGLLDRQLQADSGPTPWRPMPEWAVTALKGLRQMLPLKPAWMDCEAWDELTEFLDDVETDPPFARLYLRLVLGAEVRRRMNAREPSPNAVNVALDRLRKTLEAGVIQSDAQLIAGAIDFFCHLPSSLKADGGRPPDFVADVFAFFLCAGREQEGLPPPTPTDAGDIWLVLVGEGTHTRHQAAAMLKHHIARAREKIAADRAAGGQLIASTFAWTPRRDP